MHTQTPFTALRHLLHHYARMFLVSLVVLVSVSIPAGLWLRAQTTSTGLQATYDQNGLATLTYNGTKVMHGDSISGDRFQIEHMQFGDDTYCYFYWPACENASAVSTLVSQEWNSSAKELTRTYNWGKLIITYTQAGNTLTVKTRIVNTSSKSIKGIATRPFMLRFPGAPSFSGPIGIIRPEWAPAVFPIAFGGVRVHVANEDPRLPLYLQAWHLVGQDTIEGYGGYYLIAGSHNMIYHSPLGGRTELPGIAFDRTIPASGEDTYVVSVRFEPEGTDYYGIEASRFAQFAQRNPFTLNWPDRRPIGALFLATSPQPPNNTPNPTWNRRGYNIGRYNDQTPNMTTAEGRAAFRRALLAYADESIRILKSIGAQGMITWDIEGQEFAHAISYVCDPEMLATTAPEMESIADEYFQKFRDAGLRVGVCIRPTKFIRDARNPGKPVEAYPGYPVGPADQFPSTSTADGRPAMDEAELLMRKISYAKQRWGATLFYIDTNGDPNAPTDVSVFKRVSIAHPDVLLVPEHEHPGYFAMTAPIAFPWHEHSYGNGTAQKLYSLSMNLLHTYSPIYWTDEAARAGMRTAIARGSIPIANTWYEGDPGLNILRDVLQNLDPYRPHPQCSDGFDNEGDGKVDFPQDPGCASRDDTDEFDVRSALSPVIRVFESNGMPGQNLRYTVTAGSVDKAMAQNVSLEVFLYPGLEMVTYDPSCTFTESKGSLFCMLGNMVAGQEIGKSMTVRIAANYPCGNQSVAYTLAVVRADNADMKVTPLHQVPVYCAPSAMSSASSSSRSSSLAIVAHQSSSSVAAAVGSSSSSSSSSSLQLHAAAGESSSSSVVPIPASISPLVRCLSQGTTSTAFQDVSGHWARTYIDFLGTLSLQSTGEAISRGYESPWGGREFRPNQSITRFEFLKFLLFLTCNAPSGDSMALHPDLRTDEQRRVVGKAMAMGIAQGYEDGTFRPDAPINRAEAVKLLMGTVNLPVIAPPMNTFPDVPATAWFARYVSQSVAHGIVRGYSDGTFRPENALTRAEAIAIILRAAIGIE